MRTESTSVLHLGRGGVRTFTVRSAPQTFFNCCDDEETDSSPELSVQEDPNCEELCSGLEDDTNTGLCCASSFCWCTEIGNFLMLCEEGSQYCPEAAQCMDMTDQICQEIPWCCPAI